ncbi:MAG: YHS domain-containing protein [Elusimicrobia bacterium]|nr:YHS domain-containing protein [Elusimicrobiota bacterium]
MKKLVSALLMASAGFLLAAMPAAAKSCCPGGGEGAKSEKLCPERVAGVETAKKKLPDGLELTMTAGDKETIEKVQAAAAEHYAGGGKNCKCVPKGAEVKVENLENGVKVIITGKTPKLVKKIQAKAAKAHNCAGHKKASGKKCGVKAAAKKQAKYVCPMGCAQSDKPGKCPKCGMNLVENKEAAGKEAVCPVTGEKFKVTKETVSATYKGKVYYFCCPGCNKSFIADPGKYLKKKQAPKANLYVCPMGCAQSDKPGKCPKCGMGLVEKSDL